MKIKNFYDYLAENIDARINDIATNFNGGNAGEVKGKINDMLVGDGWERVASDATTYNAPVVQGDTWEIWQDPNGNQVKVVQTVGPSGVSAISAVHEWKGEYIELDGGIDVEKAQRLIAEHPEKYKDNGKFITFKLDVLAPYFSTGLTPEQKKTLGEGKPIEIRVVGVSIDTGYADKLTDLDKPGIWLCDPETKVNILIDGWHRAYERWKKGMKTMQAWLIQDKKTIDAIKL